MPADTKERIRCPYCQEDILSTATKCKHCQSQLRAEGPDHNGTCPYCKEDIHPDAIKCKHCHSAVGPRAAREGGCGGGCGCAPVAPGTGAMPLAMRLDNNDGPGGGGGVNEELCEWEALWGWVDCMADPLSPGPHGSDRRRRYCDTKRFFKELMCKAGMGSGGGSFGGGFSI